MAGIVRRLRPPSGVVVPALIAIACSPGAAQRAAPPSVHGEATHAAPACVGGGQASEPSTPPAAAPPALRAAPGAPALGRCFLKTPGVYGSCMDNDACMSLGGHVATPGVCGDSPSIGCCTEEPHLEVNPPAGWVNLPQPHVTAEMTAWALALVNAPTAHPMGSSTRQRFGERDVLARIEWHPPSAEHDAMHRGVSLYEPVGCRPVAHP